MVQGSRHKVGANKYSPLFIYEPFFNRVNRGKPAAARHAQKINGYPLLNASRLFPRGGARKAPTMPRVLVKPIAVPLYWLPTSFNSITMTIKRAATNEQYVR